MILIQMTAKDFMIMHLNHDKPQPVPVDDSSNRHKLE
jgi:hypothetical protein